MPLDRVRGEVFHALVGHGNGRRGRSRFHTKAFTLTTPPISMMRTQLRINRLARTTQDTPLQRRHGAGERGIASDTGSAGGLASRPYGDVEPRSEGPFDRLPCQDGGAHRGLPPEAIGS